MKNLLLLIFTSLIFLIILFGPLNIIYPENKAPIKSDPKSEIRKIAVEIDSSCKNQTSGCRETKIQNMLLNRYPIRTILDSIYDFDTYFSCHAFTHYLGRAIYYNLQNIAQAYSQIDFTCHGGSFHGVIEAYLDASNERLDQISGQKLQKICADSNSQIISKQNQIYTECVHGFGHAFMFLTNSNLPVSLKYCDKLTLPEREICYGGVFMENSTSSTNTQHQSVWIKDNDKYYPCNILNSKYLNQCYYYQANYWVKISTHNYKSVFEDCKSLNLEYQPQCVMGLGASLAGFSRNAGIVNASQTCNMVSEDLAKICIEGAIPSVIDRYGGNADFAIQFCQASASNLQEFCFVKIGYTAKRWGIEDNELAIICQKALKYQQACQAKSNIKPKYI